MRRYFPVLGLVMLVCGLAVFWKMRDRPAPKGSEKSIEQLFGEREKQAETTLKQPLAKLVQEKNWGKIKEAFPPEKFGFELAGVVRALFIDGGIRNLDAREQEKILHFLLLALKGGGLRTPEHRGMVLSQAERLLSPAPGSPSHAILKEWFKSSVPGSAEYLLAMRKLICQAARPLPDLTQALIQHIPSRWAKLTQGTLLFSLDEIRNPSTKKAVLLRVFDTEASLPPVLKPVALVVLARNPEISPRLRERLVKMSERYLQSKNIGEVEAALRTISLLHRQKPFNGSSIERIVRILTSIPESVRTPFIQAKSEEIIRLLQP